MSIKLKTNLLLLALGIIGATGFAVYNHFQTRALLVEQAFEQAALISSYELASRNYTAQTEPTAVGHWLKPESFHRRLKLGVSESRSRSEIHTGTANGTKAVAEGAQGGDVGLNADFKKELVHYFNKHRAVSLQKGTVTRSRQQYFYVARPIISYRSCLACHGNGADGAKFQKVGHQIGATPKRQLNRVAGVLITYLPVGPVFENSEMAAFKIVAAGIGIALLALLVIWFFMDAVVTKPLDDLTRVVDEMSRGQGLQETIKSTRKDEIGKLYLAFNRMRISVLKLLEIVRAQEE